MLTFLLSVFVLTPLAAVQTFLGAGIISIILTIKAGDFSGSDFMPALLAVAALVGVNKLVCLVRYGRGHSFSFYILDFIFSPLRLPLQIITDVMALIAIFADIDVCPRNEPDIKIDGLFDYITIYFLQYERGGKVGYTPSSRPASSTPSRPAASRPTASRPSYTNTASNQPTDPRKKDTGVFTNALEKAIDRQVIYGGSSFKFLPSASLGRLEWNGYLSRLVFWGKVTMRGKVTYYFDEPDCEYTVQRIKDDGDYCLKQVVENVKSAVLDVIDDVREGYQGFDNEWKVYVELNLEFKPR